MTPSAPVPCPGLYYRRYGRGRPLLVLHGLFGSGRNWRRIAQALEQDRQVITVDLRNHGASPHCAGMDYADMSADILVLMDELGLETADLMGHSMGGKVAMSLALSQPGRVSRLVVVDIAPVHYRHDFQAIFESLKALPLERLQGRAEAERLLLERLKDPVLTGFLLQNLQRDDEQGFHWRVNLPALEQGMEAISGFPEDLLEHRYDGPALFIAGAESRHIRPGHQARIKTLFPRAVIATIDGTGHWPHSERPETFLDALRGFLRA